MILGGWSRRLIAAFISVTILLTTVAGAVLPASADISPSPVQGIQISPVLINLNGDKGQSYKLTLHVTNVTAGPLVLTSAVNDFKAENETGNPKIILNNSQPVGTYSLRNWISPVPPFTLQAHQTQIVNFSVNIPPNGESGGHYGVIRFSGTPPAQSGQSVALNASVGVLILTRVAGHIVEKLSLAQLFTEQNGHQTGVIQNGALTIVTRIQNVGNVHVEPVGDITVKNTWGKTVATYPFGSVDKNVLPASIRRYDQNFAKAALFGHYSVNLTAAYGTSGGVLTGSITFWVIPYKLIILFIVILVMVLFIGRRLLKGYNQRVIRRHANDGPRPPHKNT
jgi:hypothetical protein